MFCYNVIKAKEKKEMKDQNINKYKFLYLVDGIDWIYFSPIVCLVF
jgi:hypothetical protein